MELLIWGMIYRLFSRDAANSLLHHVEAGESVLEAPLTGSQRPEMDRQDRLDSAMSCVPRKLKSYWWDQCEISGSGSFVFAFGSYSGGYVRVMIEAT